MDDKEIQERQKLECEALQAIYMVIFYIIIIFK